MQIKQKIKKVKHWNSYHTLKNSYYLFKCCVCVCVCVCIILQWSPIFLAPGTCFNTVFPWTVEVVVQAILWVMGSNRNGRWSFSLLPITQPLLCSLVPNRLVLGKGLALGNPWYKAFLNVYTSYYTLLSFSKHIFNNNCALGSMLGTLNK